MSGTPRGDWCRRIAAEAVRRGGGRAHAPRPAEPRRGAVVQPGAIPGPDHAKRVDVSGVRRHHPTTGASPGRRTHTGMPACGVQGEVRQGPES